MFYYISTNSWNLLESFVSESISPFSFYQVRGYGNNLSRYLDGTNERANYLILSAKEINGDYVLRVNDEILDKSNIAPVKIVKLYLHTIRQSTTKRELLLFCSLQEIYWNLLLQNRKYCLK